MCQNYVYNPLTQGHDAQVIHHKWPKFHRVILFENLWNSLKPNFTCKVRILYWGNGTLAKNTTTRHFFFPLKINCFNHLTYFLNSTPYDYFLVIRTFSRLRSTRPLWSQCIISYKKKSKSCLLILNVALLQKYFDLYKLMYYEICFIFSFRSKLLFLFRQPVYKF